MASVRIVEVGPRDGLQNIKITVPTATKLDLIEKLKQSGLKCIEVASVVSPKAVPQLADCRKVLDSALVQGWLRESQELRLPVLIPNAKGFQIALEYGVKEIAVFISATEGFSRANINCTVDQGIERARQVAAEAARHGIAVRGVFDSSVAGLGGCPFAPGATGNVATEDIVYMFHQAGIETGVDLPRLAETGVWISQQLSKSNDSRVGVALASKARKQPPVVTEKPSTPSSLPWTLIRDAQGVLVYRSGANGKIVLNTPANGNALTPSLISDLRGAFVEFEQDASIRRIIITSSGKFFCTGMDLGKGTGTFGADSKDKFNALTTLFELIDNSTKVTVACVNGPAFGGGVGLAFVCDLRLSISSASFTLSEVKLGLCPAVISKYVIREWGVSRSREAMITARPVTAKELRAWGVISHIAESPSDLQRALDTCLHDLRLASSSGIRMSKELVRLGWSQGGSDNQKRNITRLFEEMMGPESEAVYGVRQFRAARRAVDWDALASPKAQSKPRL
ncbi:Hydroxymethylglutaryl-CoA lyase [Scedosporium apiospermum]|uniref:hydroxymethylglutaryl-CoA lyase n=1 Tax=Pseudallescheria apiosperma TaxID=563466 RepID=A0A084FWY1_PSEDA|nr:Hydroxymethylglutaryl-CoA lyase [Scedosporium apiospermum]KEZ39593.1 Hydroxymethylglutaryl-CoA lyase [Scedosporium apiospermum]